MMINFAGPDRVVAKANAFHYELRFKPLVDASYYIKVSGNSQLVVTWTFSYFQPK